MSELRSAVEAVRDTDLATLTDAALLSSVEDLLEGAAILDAALARRLAAVDRRESAVTECGRTTRGWLHEELRVSAVEAGRRVAVARGLAYHPQLAAAFDAGDVSLEHARVINSCLGHLPISVHDTAESILVDAARTLPPDELRPVVDKLRDTFAGDTLAEREQRRYASRWARADGTFDGMLHLEAMLDPESGQTLLVAVQALMGVRSESDDRTAEQRRADALVDLARRSLSHGELPEVNGDRPHVAVTIDWATLRDETAAASGAAGTLTGIDAGTSVTVETVRRLACDAAVIPAVLGGDRQVLDLGRSTPTWTVHQRRAAALRDGGCVFDGCRAAVDRCQLHHIAHWAAHRGLTDIDNSAYLCHFHHWLVHRRSWTISRDRATKKVSVMRT